MRFRFRSLAATLLVTGGAALLFAGCSSRPENSPVLKKKFAEMDKQSETIERLTADIRLLNDRVLTLVQENEQMKAFLPDVDGQSAVDKITKLEARLRQVESMAASGVMSATALPAPTTPRDTETASAVPHRSRPVDLVTAPLATGDTTTVDAAPAEDLPVVAAQQQAPAARPVDTFREKTASSASKLTKSSAPAEPRAAKTAPAAPKAAAKAAAAPKANRGAWHVIAQGETIDAIAAKHGTTAQAVSQANSLPRGARLAKGQRLFIPGAK